MPRMRVHPRKYPLLERIARQQAYKHGRKPIGVGPKGNQTWIPRLWNTHRRLSVSRGLPPNAWKELEDRPELLLDVNEPWPEKAKDETWTGRHWKIKNREAYLNRPSQDVIDFMKKVRLLPSQKQRLLRYPSRYFSFSRNVPEHARRNVYFPDFTVTLLRTPNLPPKFATFVVPLWFSKLDLKSYLQNVYSVPVIYIRSTVLHSKVQRREGSKDPRFEGNGPFHRPRATKRMTVTLETPFVWPELPTDRAPWSVDSTWRMYKGSREESAAQEESTTPKKPDKRHRVSIAQQAKALLDGSDKWKPTWESLATEAVIMRRPTVTTT